MPFALPVGWLRQTRQALREERDLLDVLLNSVDVAVVACDARGRVTHVNRRTHELMSGSCSTGLDPEGWIQALRPRTALGVPLTLSELPLVRAVQGEMIRDVDVLIQTGTGEVLLSASANPVEDERGQATRSDRGVRGCDRATGARGATA